MSKKLVVAALVLAALGACAKKEEVVISEPVTTEPGATGKYK